MNLQKLENLLQNNKPWMIDEFTDHMFKRDETLVFPEFYHYHVRVSLSAYYEYGEIQYYLAIVYSANDWRYVRQYDLTAGLYRYFMADLYPYFDSQFSDKGTQKVYCDQWWAGCFQRDYNMGQTFDLPQTDLQLGLF